MSTLYAANVFHAIPGLDSIHIGKGCPIYHGVWARTLPLILVRVTGYRPRAVGGQYNIFVALETADPAFARVRLSCVKHPQMLLHVITQGVINAWANLLPLPVCETAPYQREVNRQREFYCKRTYLGEAGLDRVVADIDYALVRSEPLLRDGADDDLWRRRTVNLDGNNVTQVQPA